ncbi:hypothetical protein [Paraburkholderia sp. GAS32]|uniref:hypothetical protein n=1 Tax=Paraburkholderia sp. GAS32 TaxID=3035129 RepID=UPI003D1BC955
MKTENAVETLRSSFTAAGTRVFMVFDPARAAAHKPAYRLATRWRWLAAFSDVWAAGDAFEALEMSDCAGQEHLFGKWAMSETRRVPRHHFGNQRNTWARVRYLLNSVERRMQGLRPQRCGSKGSVERWIPAPA